MTGMKIFWEEESISVKYLKLNWTGTFCKLSSRWISTLLMCYTQTVEVCPETKSFTLTFFNSLQSDKILDLSKLKAFEADKINATQTLKFHLGRVENVAVKGENSGYQHFLLFPQFLQKPSSFGLFKVKIVWEKVKQCMVGIFPSYDILPLQQEFEFALRISGRLWNIQIFGHITSKNSLTHYRMTKF